MRRLLPWSAFLALLTASAAPAITLGQIDDFEAGTLQNWGGGSAPTHIATGGPAGTDDAFLRIRASSSHLGAKNTVQWAGNYAAAGVSALEIDLNNFGPNPVALRITLFGPDGTFTNANETILAPGSGWVTVTFGLSSADLTQTSGIGTLAGTLAAVNTLLIRHDGDPISAPRGGNLVTAALGIDNVTAVPEPASGLLVALGVGTLAAIRRNA